MWIPPRGLWGEAGGGGGGWVQGCLLIWRYCPHVRGHGNTSRVVHKHCDTVTLCWIKRKRTPLTRTPRYLEQNFYFTVIYSQLTRTPRLLELKPISLEVFFQSFHFTISKLKLATYIYIYIYMFIPLPYICTEFKSRIDFRDLRR